MSIALESPERQRGWWANDLSLSDVEHSLARFQSKYHRGGPDECWPWLAAKNPGGYGLFRMPRSFQPTLLAHRVAWVAATGTALSDNLTIDHLCFSRDCVNPGHLEPVTLEENVRRRNAARGWHPDALRPSRLPQHRAIPQQCPECEFAGRPGNMARHRARRH